MFAIKVNNINLCEVKASEILLFSCKEGDAMQADINHWIIALSVRRARITGIILQSALRSYLESKRH